MSRRVLTSGNCKDKALSFNGVDEYIDNNNVYDIVDNDFTLAMWYRSNGAQGDIFAQTKTTANTEAYQFANGNIEFYAVSTSTGNGLTITGNYNDNSWRHFAFTKSGLSLQVYVNGTLQASGTDANIFGTLINSGLRFASWAGSASPRFLACEIDELQLFNKVLSTSEVQEIYNNGKPINPLSYSFVDSLVAAYPLGENDTFGSNGVENLVGVNGTAVNMNSSNIVCGVESSIIDCTSNALRFNGSDEYIDIGTSWYPWAGGDTVSLWFKSNDFGGLKRIFNIQTTTNGNIIYVTFNYPANGDVSFYRQDGNDSRAAVASGNYNDGNWHHVVGTWDGTTRRIYVNGVLKDTNNLAGSNSSSSNSGFIGQRNNAQYFNGVIDEFSVFSSALSQTEVDELYNQGIPLDATTHSQSSNLSAYWRFTDSDTFGSNGILDSSGNANHGTATNMDSTNLVCGVDNDPQIICNSDEILDLNPVLYLDRACANFTVSSGSAVSQWNDISGNNYHATQSTVSARPILTPESVGFDGVNDSMQTTSFGRGAAPLAVFIDANIISPGSSGSGWLVSQRDQSSVDIFQIYFNNSSITFVTFSSPNIIVDTFSYNSFSLPFNGKLLLYTNGINSNAVKLAVNGVVNNLGNLTVSILTSSINFNINASINNPTSVYYQFMGEVEYRRLAYFNTTFTDAQAIDLTS